MNTIPLACDMTVFTSAERDNHVQTTRLLVQSLQTIRPVSNGFEFLFSTNTETITQMAEFISNERLCCPFLEFTLRIAPGDEPISLTLTGPDGTQQFLSEEFSEAFA